MRARDVVFLDRDGTLIHDRPGHYLRSPGAMRVYPFTAEALRLLRAGGFRLVVISNQSGIGRGFLDRATLARIHRRLASELARGGARLDAIYFCPHHPDDACKCRKPSPLLARRAVRELGLSLRRAAVIGDKKADVDLARALDVPSVLVRTGHFRSQRARYGAALRPTHQSRNLLTAARWLLRRGAAAALLLGLLGGAARAADPGATAAAESVARARIEVSSKTVSQPSDLVGGELPAATPHAPVPWFPEFLEYEVKWGIFSVGTSNLQVRRIVDFNGTPAFHVVSEAISSRFCDRFYKVRDLNESWVRASDLVSLGYSKKLREGHFWRDEWVVYDYDRKRFLSKTTNREGQFTYADGAIPGPVQDILSSMFFLRAKPLKVGDEIVLDVNTKQNWPLVVKVLRKKRIETPAGKFNTVEVEPFLREEGIFIQKGKRLQVWLTDDERHIPVQMSVEVVFGNVTATLIRAERPKK